jgi:hypothetical protein
MTDQPEFDLNAIRAAFRAAVLSDDMAVACRIMERAAGIEEPLVVRRFPEMAWYIAFQWTTFYEPEDRAASLKHWLAAERLWPTIKIKSERIFQVPG